MKHIKLISLFACIMACAGTASANQLFNFDFSIGNNAGYGSLDTVDQGGGNFLAVSGALTVTDSTDAADIGIFSLLAGGPGNTNSPSGKFYFNNVLHSLSNPVLDLAGLLFTGNGLEVNIYGNDIDTYSFESWNGARYNVADVGQIRSTFNLTPVAQAQAAVPEPTTLALFGLGLVGFGLSRRKRV